VLLELESLFGHTEYPGDAALADSWPNEWESTFEQLSGKDWRTVQIDDFDSQGGAMEGILMLSAAGFIYFLPGLIRIALFETEQMYIVTNALVTRFTCCDNSQGSFENERKIIAGLSVDQREFLVSFFREIQKKDRSICPVLIESAIRNLTTGSIEPYQYIDVQRWASENN
jgi:hypothetical protein